MGLKAKADAGSARPGRDGAAGHTLDDARALVLAEATARAGRGHGWSEEMLDEAAAAAGVVREQLKLAFPAGLASLLSAFCAAGDERALAILADEKLDEMRIRDRITRGVLARLEADAPHKQAVRAAITAFAAPGLAAEGARALYATSDCLWQAAGDTARDYNRYTKRLILSGVFSSTVLVWLADTTPGEARTAAFLAQRIDDVMRFEKTKAKARDLFAGFLARGGRGPV